MSTPGHKHMPIVTPAVTRTAQVGHTQQRTYKCVHTSYRYQIRAHAGRQSTGKTLRSMTGCLV